LYPALGLLFPEGLERLKKCDDADQVKTAVDSYPTYRELFNDTQFNEEKTLEDSFFEHEVKLHKDAFFRQGGFAAFYSFFKLKEQEIRNIVWIAECIMQDVKSKMGQIIQIF
jgi:V-type H+-transporting ATPase subunit d